MLETYPFSHGRFEHSEGTGIWQRNPVHSWDTDAQLQILPGSQKPFWQGGKQVVVMQLFPEKPALQRQDPSLEPDDLTAQTPPL